MVRSLNAARENDRNRQTNSRNIARSYRSPRSNTTDQLLPALPGMVCWLVYHLKMERAQSFFRAKSYYVSDPKGAELAGYGVMMLSKYKFHQLALRNFPSKYLASS